MNENEKKVLNQNKDTLKPLLERLVEQERDKAVRMKAGYDRDIYIDATFKIEDIINSIFTENKKQVDNSYI